MTAKTNAQRQATKIEKEKQDLARLGGRICRLHLPDRPDAALAQLMEWHGVSDWREAIQTLLLRLQEAGPEASAPFLAVSRHKISVSAKVSRQLAEFVAPAEAE
jgi:hypothetical protein